MKRLLLFISFLLLVINASAQASFNGGWHIYKTGSLTTEYSYKFDFKDSLKLSLTDSAQTFAAPDSMVMLTIRYALYEKAIYKSTSYYNKYRQLIKKENYKGNAMIEVEEWKYDKNKMTSYARSDKVKNNNYLTTYTYEEDKSTGGFIMWEMARFNGRTEFYTKNYYDKKNVLYKQVRLNDNKKDIVHVESYKYDSRGHVSQRSVFFPEFGVTKKFNEDVPDESEKCLKIISIAKEKMEKTKELFIKKLFLKNQPAILEKDCKNSEVKLINYPGYNIIFQQLAKDNKKTVTVRVRNM